jgi:hypothetical protein
MTAKQDFLQNMSDILSCYCDVIKIDLSPSQSNIAASYLYLEGRGGPSENALDIAKDKLGKASRLRVARGRDGNHHKLGKMVRQKGNYVYDAAEALTKVNPAYMEALERTARFITDMKGMTPNNIARHVDHVVFSKDHKKLKL